MKPKVYIYNSLSRKAEEFHPLKANTIGIYACGVTVYDDCHIGHARSLYIFEVIRNFLKYIGYNVKLVRNITDIDDKIINKARQLGLSCTEIASKFINSFEEDLRLLNLSQADIQPWATRHIDEMKKLITILIEKGYAYEAGGDVYFSVKKFKGYGKLSGQSIDQMRSGVRIEPGEAKKDPLDFALWKKSKEGEPSWPSDWGAGRPGWHIECSAMSSKYLGQPFDIHAGGRDLIFPHHENEIAQSEASAGKQFAKYWIHHGLLTIGGQKMAKSLGNFLTIKDFMNKYHNAEILKLFFLNAHYSKSIDFNEQSIEEARQKLERIMILVNIAKSDPKTFKSPARNRNAKDVKGLKQKFIDAMCNDFNTSQALAAIFELVKLANKNINNSDIFRKSQTTIRELLGIFGIVLKTDISTKPAVNINEAQDLEINTKIKERETARQEGNYALADKIRKELEEKDIILEDNKEGTKWRRKI